MPEAQARRPCPVCLGVKLSKLRIVAREDLLLDRCERCGGIWFDAGEVARLGTYRFQGVRQKILPSAEAFHMSCHGCGALMDRNAEKCPACGWRNVLDCPLCERPMKRRQVRGWHLDFCTPCRGAWFDRIELAEIWNLYAEEPRQRSSAGVPTMAGSAVEAGAEVVEILSWSPDAVLWGAEAVGHSAELVASGVAQAASAVPEVLEGAGELAGGVFETIADVIGALFS